MAGRVRHGLLAVAIGVACTVAQPSADGIEPESFTIRVLEANQTGAAPAVLRSARAETARIFRALGIAVVWADRTKGNRNYDFVIMVAPRAMKNNAIDSRALGIALGEGNTRGTMAYVFLDRIESLADRLEAAPGVILGHVIAHELGHLLLPHDAHAVSGVMKGRWDSEQAMLAMRAALTFTAGEAALIRARLQMQTPVATAARR